MNEYLRQRLAYAIMAGIFCGTLIDMLLYLFIL